VLRKRSRTGILTSAAALVLMTLVAAPASAAEAPWYLSALKLDAGAAEGFTGKGVTVAVIDGQINPDVPTLADADVKVREPSFCFEEDGSPAPAATDELGDTKPTDHGTNVVSMIVGSGAGYDGQQGIVGVAPGATVRYYAIYTSKGENESLSCLDKRGQPEDGLPAAVNQAVEDGADIISVSLSFAGSAEFTDAIARALRQGVIVLGSLNNSSVLEISGGMPAMANGVVSVQAAGRDGQIQSTDGKPNENGFTDLVAPGLGITVQGDESTGQWSDQFPADGTSLATPIAAGILSLVKEKYPKATGNQLIQSLIRNTSGEPDREPALDPARLIGYGLVSITNMMSVDPTTYEDSNPLIQRVADRNDLLEPTYEQIYNTATATPDPAAVPEDGSEPSSALPTWIWVAVGGLGVVLVAVLIIVLSVRRRAPRTDR
jgi:subtilisin family serine protease